MTPKSRFFQARFSATLLKSAAIAVALLVQASPARAEVVTLICQNDYRSQVGMPGPSSFTLRINYDQKVVELLSPSGTVQFSAAASITESDVQWLSDEERRFSGTLNRLSGESFVWYYETESMLKQVSGPCRRATQKF